MAMVTDAISFSKEFDTYILAFCPDTDSWFATNQRNFFLEYPKEFASEKDAVDYFVTNPYDFYKEEIGTGIPLPACRTGKLYLENIHKFINV